MDETRLTLLELYGVEMSFSNREFSTVRLWNFRVRRYYRKKLGCLGRCHICTTPRSQNTRRRGGGWGVRGHIVPSLPLLTHTHTPTLSPSLGKERKMSSTTCTRPERNVESVSKDLSEQERGGENFTYVRAFSPLFFWPFLRWLLRSYRLRLRGVRRRTKG